MPAAHMELPHESNEWPRMKMWQAIGLSMLIHALMAAALFGLIRQPETKAEEPDYYTVNIVEPKDVPPPPAPSVPPSAQERPTHMRSSGTRPPAILARPESQPAPSEPPAATPPIMGLAPAMPEPAQPRVRLLDPEVIGDIALSRAPSEPQVEKGGVTFDTGELMYKGYMDLLRDKIQSIWVYPSAAAERKLYGDLYINFTIRRDGTLGAVKVVRTSGYSVLDEAALAALRNAQPYWPLPEAWKMEALTVKGHFIYALEGYYIR